MTTIERLLSVLTDFVPHLMGAVVVLLAALLPGCLQYSLRDRKEGY